MSCWLPCCMLCQAPPQRSTATHAVQYMGQSERAAAAMVVGLRTGECVHKSYSSFTIARRALTPYSDAFPLFLEKTNQDSRQCSHPDHIKPPPCVACIQLADCIHGALQCMQCNDELAMHYALPGQLYNKDRRNSSHYSYHWYNLTSTGINTSRAVG